MLMEDENKTLDENLSDKRSMNEDMLCRCQNPKIIMVLYIFLNCFIVLNYHFIPKKKKKHNSKTIRVNN